MRISVSLCTYNGASFLAEQLASIAAQTRLPDEVVICDDISADESIRVVSAFSSSCSFPVRIHRNSINLGSCKNFEQAIGLCTGDLIALSDQDDIWHPEKLARIEAAFADSPGLGALFSDANLIDETGASLHRTLWESVGFSKRLRNAVRSGNGFDALLLGNFVTGATLAFRADWNRLLLPIPAGWVHDHWIALLLAAVSRIDFVDEPLISYRSHPSQERGVKERNICELWQRFANLHGSDYSKAALLREGLADHLQCFDPQRFARQISKCEAMAIHLKRRAALPPARLFRVPMIVKEILNSNYFVHAFGLKSVLRDIVARH